MLRSRLQRFLGYKKYCPYNQRLNIQLSLLPVLFPAGGVKFQHVNKLNDLIYITMSDVLQKYCDFKKFKDDIVIDTDHCLRYVNTQCVNSDEIVFTVHITNNVLKQWQDLKDTQQSKDISFSFVEILNLFLAQNHAIVIKKDCSRIEERLRRLASVAKRNSSGKRGRTSLW